VMMSRVASYFASAFALSLAIERLPVATSLQITGRLRTCESMPDILSGRSEGWEHFAVAIPGSGTGFPRTRMLVLIVPSSDRIQRANSHERGLAALACERSTLALSSRTDVPGEAEQDSGPSSNSNRPKIGGR
jgi:hypothetical protein